ncbi:hypothetical protein LOAG_08361 [Loa loa]|uniref:Uncharacterized protein n=1 Tax=Loa loa TaxID=7209 RepID=A0A1S0TTR5_LOALO|nr:hypothetical protein LOAG_08361 [Loa loa]EFO20128.1 hypothetical protein LOAG_08361 [Loa loa]
MRRERERDEEKEREREGEKEDEEKLVDKREIKWYKKRRDEKGKKSKQRRGHFCQRIEKGEDERRVEPQINRQKLRKKIGNEGERGRTRGRGNATCRQFINKCISNIDI